VLGWKDVENRSRRTSFRGDILVHASKTQPDLDALAGMRRYVHSRKDWPKDTRYEPDFGCIIGMVTIVDCVTESKSDYFQGAYGWVLADAVMFDEPIEYSGKVGIFYVSRRLLKGTPAGKAQAGKAG
jgi:hypothetical protein